MTQKKMGGSARKAFAIVRPSVIATTFSARSIKYFRLQRTNGVLAGLYLVQATLIAILGHSAKVPVTLSYLASDPLASAAEHKNVLAFATHSWFDANLLALVVTMLLLAAIFHGLLATVLRARYENGMAKKLQDLRWGGYALIGGLAMIITSLVVGVSDAGLLFALFGLVVLMALGAMAIEANARLWPWVLFAAVAAAAVVLGLGTYIVGGLLYGSALPAYAYVALVLTLGGAAVAATNLLLQLRGAKEWADYLFAEEGYMALNLVVGSALAWVIFAGALHA
jgi:hypothetical protein